MSELKYQLMLNKDMSWVPCYLKSEADREFCNQRRERCMAMADRCRERFHRYVVLICFSPNKGAISFYERRRDRAYKWMYKWREIADKLKEGV